MLIKPATHLQVWQTIQLYKVNVIFISWILLVQHIECGQMVDGISLPWHMVAIGKNVLFVTFNWITLNAIFRHRWFNG